MMAHEHITFVRRPDGRWRLWGRIPSWCFAADESHIYYVVGEVIWSVPIDRPSADPKKVCDTPAKLPVRSLTTGAGRLFAATEQRELLCEWSLSGEPGWRKLKFPEPALRIATDGRSLFAHNNRLYRRPLDPAGAEWVLEEMPPNVMHLAVWGDRLLGIPKYEGPIHARPLAEGSDARWDVIGRVYKPPE
jgi:hypothetical protein